MTYTSPIAILYDKDGYAISSLNPLRIDPVGTTPQTVTGTVTVNGTVTANIGTSDSLALDATLTNGSQKTEINQTDATKLKATVIGSGIAGTPASGVFTVQGISGATAIPTKVASASAANITNVAASTSSTLLLAANVNRMGATIFNASTAILYLKFGTGASINSYTTRMSANSYYEVPFNYSGVLNGAWASTNGYAYVTELLP